MVEKGGETLIFPKSICFWMVYICSVLSIRLAPSLQAVTSCWNGNDNCGITACWWVTTRYCACKVLFLCLFDLQSTCDVRQFATPWRWLEIWLWVYCRARTFSESNDGRPRFFTEPQINIYVYRYILLLLTIILFYSSASELWIYSWFLPTREFFLTIVIYVLLWGPSWFFLSLFSIFICAALRRLWLGC